MLSILIPIYNQDVRTLVYNLAKQCNKLNINYQILCFDDGSTEKFKSKNKELAFKMNINYTELPENLGRSKIRNWLGKAAYFEYLLFLDGDSSVRNKDFIRNYINNLPTNGIIYGGRLYQKNQPANIKKILHWKYGTKIEAQKAKNRNKNPYLNFQSNNFLIPEKIFNNCHFEENVEGYGYEDLQYAEKLRQSSIPIVHIDNPIYHDGIEYNNVFLVKTKTAIDNLIFLENKNQIPQTRIAKTYLLLKDYGLVSFFMFLSTKYISKIERNLLSTKPYLFLLQVWKLNYYIRKKLNYF